MLRRVAAAECPRLIFNNNIVSVVFVGPWPADSSCKARPTDAWTLLAGCGTRPPLAQTDESNRNTRNAGETTWLSIDLDSGYQSTLAVAVARCCCRALCSRQASQVPCKALKITPTMSAGTQ